MRVIAFFDWNVFLIQDAFRCVSCSFTTQFESPLIGVLTRDGKIFRSSDISQLMREFEAFSSSASLEVYAGCRDTADPEAFWDSYVSYSAKVGGKKDFLIALNNSEIRENEIIETFLAITRVSDIRYGFSFDRKNRSDGRFFAKGISTEKSSERERGEDSRWFNERLVMKGQSGRQNRHLVGYFKDVFEFNLIDEFHLQSIQDLSDCLGSIRNLGSGRYLWIPKSDNIARIRAHLQDRDLII